MGSYEARTGLSSKIPSRLAGPDQPGFVQRRPIVDVRTLAAKAANELLDVLLEYQEKVRKADKSFLKRKPPVPEIGLSGMIKNIKHTVLEQYQISAARSEPPILELNEAHLAEVAELQERAVELFCRQALPAVKDNNVLAEQLYQVCPGLKPLPDPDGTALLGLQEDFDQMSNEVMAVFNQLVEKLSSRANELAEHEKEILRGTNRTGSIREKARALQISLSRHLEVAKTVTKGEVK